MPEFVWRGTADLAKFTLLMVDLNGRTFFKAATLKIKTK
jgi:hypothetical protein